MADPSLALQVAIFEHLTIQLAPVSVFNKAPQNQAQPYVLVGDDLHLPWDTDDSVGAESVLTLHIWSVQRGSKEVKTIQGQIYEALHRHELIVDGFSTITLEFESAEILEDPDGVSTHGVSKFRTLLEAD